MNLYLTIWFFVVGTVMGSFFGVVGGRIPEGKSIIKPRSHCYYCNHELKWYELIPIFSYIIQKGKCRNCHKNISIFYPIIELITGILFATSFIIFGFTYNLIISLIIVSFLSIVLVCDITYLMIPDSFTIVFSIMVIITNLFSKGFFETLYSVLSGIVMFIIMYAIMLIGNKIFKKECLGGADIKLMFFVGLILPVSLGMYSIFIASALALPISLFFVFKNKNNVIPFGPFILLALFLIFSFNLNLNFLIV